jgi:hypothetical protein
MIKKFQATLALLISLFIIHSCTKQANEPTTNAFVPTSKDIVHANTIINPQANGLNSSAVVLYNASSQTLKNHYQTFVASINTTPPVGGRPLACPILWNTSSILKTATLTSGSFCAGTAIVDVTYQWLVWESGSGGGIPSNYIFSINAGINGFVTATNVNPIANTTLSCNPNVNPCPHLITYDITFSLTGFEYSGAQTTNRVNGYGPNTCNSTINLDQIVSLSYPNSYYTGNPARIFIDNMNAGEGNLLIFTECVLCGTPPHTECPLAPNLFEYRILNSGGSWNQFSFNNSGSVLTGLQQNTDYEYKCTLNYSFGQSQVNTGVVHVNEIIFC